MELYEALKSGTTPMELEAAFRDDLDKALERLAAEEKTEMEKAKAARETELDSFRSVVANDIYDYACALLGKDSVNDAGVTFDNIKKRLIESEKELVQISKITKRMDELLNKINSKKASDDDIISNFLKQLH
jgi:predicted restriction endonuclease